MQTHYVNTHGGSRKESLSGKRVRQDFQYGFQKDGMMGNEKFARVVVSKLHGAGCGIQTERNRADETVRVPDLDAAIVPGLGKMQGEQRVGNFRNPCQSNRLHGASPPQEPEQNKPVECRSFASSASIAPGFSARHATPIRSLATGDTRLGKLRRF